MSLTPRSPLSLGRRDFLRGSIRYGLLTALAAVGAAATRNRGGQLPGQTCANDGICSPCPNAADCGLPQALSFRQVCAARRQATDAKKGGGA